MIIEFKGRLIYNVGKLNGKIKKILGNAFHSLKKKDEMCFHLRVKPSSNTNFTPYGNTQLIPINTQKNSPTSFLPNKDNHKLLSSILTWLKQKTDIYCIIQFSDFPAVIPSNRSIDSNYLNLIPDWVMFFFLQIVYHIRFFYFLFGYGFLMLLESHIKETDSFPPPPFILIHIFTKRCKSFTEIVSHWEPTFIIFGML